MGIVWEAYHKGVPLFGVPEITLDFFPPLSSAIARKSLGAAPGQLAEFQHLTASPAMACHGVSNLLCLISGTSWIFMDVHGFSHEVCNLHEFQNQDSTFKSGQQKTGGQITIRWMFQTNMIYLDVQ